MDAQSKQVTSDPRLDSVCILIAQGDTVQARTLRQLLEAGQHRAITAWFFSRLTAYRLQWPAERTNKLTEAMVCSMLDFMQEQRIATDIL
jgi:hypothetical protein